MVVSGHRGVRITAVNELAAAQGIVVDMGLADARAILPNLQSAPASLDHDCAALNALARWCGRYGPARHRDGPDGIWIDVTGVAHLFGGEHGLMVDLYRALARFGISASIGLADTLGAAHALARFGYMQKRLSSPPNNMSADDVEGCAQLPIFFAPPGKTKQYLAPLTVHALRLSPDTVVLLKRLGLSKIGQLYDLPRDAIARRFRSKLEVEAVLLRLDQALGQRQEPRKSLVEPPALRAQKSWPDPLISSEGIEAETQVLIADLAAQLEHAGLGCRLVRLALYRADGSVGNVRVGMSRATRDPKHIFTLLREKFANIDAGFGVDVMTLDAFQAEPLAENQTVLQAGQRQDLGQGVGKDPSQLVDRLVNRLGQECVQNITLRESHVPERAQVMVSAITSGSANNKLAPAIEAESSAFNVARYRPPLRPLFLFSRPEPITVMAEIPEGAPQRFTWRRVRHRVVQAQGPERIAPEWWRDITASSVTASSVSGAGVFNDVTTNASPGKVVARANCARTRDYYCVEVTSGAIYWVFRDGLYDAAYEMPDVGDDAVAPSPKWFVHGVFG